MRIQDRRIGRASPTPLFEKKGCGFETVDCITRINLIVVNMQCLQYVFHSLLSLRKDRVYVTIARPHELQALRF